MTRKGHLPYKLWMYPHLPHTTNISSFVKCWPLASTQRTVFDSVPIDEYIFFLTALNFNHILIQIVEQAQSSCTELLQHLHVMCT